MKKQGKSQLEEIEEAVSVLRRGGVIIFPTDTVYGMGCRANDPIAKARIRRIKMSRQEFPVLIDNIERAHEFAKFNQAAIHLTSKYWPGALTLILPSKKTYGKIGLRIPDSALVKSIIKKLDEPIIGTSANFHGQKSATSYGQLDKKLTKKVDLVIKGECKLKQESTVVDATFSPPRILRRGAVLIQ